MPTLLLTLGLAGALSPSTAARLERTAPMMGTRLLLTVEAETRGQALAASELAVQAIEATERRLSTWRPDSELSALNRAPAGERHPLSPALYAELEAARQCWRRTQGAFDPGIGAVLDGWDLRGTGRAPGADELAALRSAGGLAALTLEPGAAVRRSPELRLEEGGFGKGAGLDRALEALAAARFPGRALLDLGGQVAVYGAGPAFEIAVADPRDRQRPVMTLALDAGSASTSGNSEHGFVVEGRRHSHLFEPATGRPARDFGSLTVVTAGALEADCLSTGLYVLGPEAALAWAAGQPGVELVVIETLPRGRLRATVTAGLAGKVEGLVPDLDEVSYEQRAPLDLESRAPAARR